MQVVQNVQGDNIPHAGTMPLLQSCVGRTSTMDRATSTSTAASQLQAFQELVATHDKAGDAGTRCDNAAGDLHGLEHMEGEVLDNRALTHSQLQSIIKEDVGQWHAAWRHGINE
jgi:hypothetical protein